ncbi:hypothetical protein KXJ69_09745 [Aureisphaera sp. CAU 1614]|uniref:YbbR-like domain-containing protein n=1 Tax=Halomarinibacterium sedimenti TaxID=2857106 RepID=A0A9X1JVV1_9FLAO|nr:CdaR family protein [Halomarinibacterium sedimenti]MBW2938389.1 hypothetical protein [Halomarinibacterium sedimenti]
MVSENTKNKNPKIKSFLFFLLLATLFWFLTKFSRDSEATLTTTLDYINIPDSLVLTNDNVKEITFDVSGNGFQLLSHKLRKTSLKIDVSAYYKEEDSIIVLPLQDIQKLILKQLNLSDIKNISETELMLHLDKNASKRIPISLQSHISFKDGYFQKGKIKIMPDSVDISGPSEEIDTITFIPTQLFKRKDVSKGLTETINLIKPQNKKVVLNPKSVSIRIEAEEFSQMTMEIPVEVINLTEGTELKLFPESIEITFDVSIKDFGNLTIDDFKIICDFSERIEEGSFMIPKLIKHPENLQHLELETKKVEFLIFK